MGFFTKKKPFKTKCIFLEAAVVPFSYFLSIKGFTFGNDLSIITCEIKFKKSTV